MHHAHAHNTTPGALQHPHMIGQIVRNNALNLLGYFLTFAAFIADSDSHLTASRHFMQ